MNNKSGIRTLLFLERERLQQERDVRNAKLENEFKSARIRGVNHCVQCGWCCHRHTCVPTPNEVIEIAKFLEISTPEFINKFCSIDRLRGRSEYYPKPLGENVKDRAGKCVPWRRTYNEGKCIFLESKDGKSCCKIYPARPLQAREAKCWGYEEPVGKEFDSWKDNRLLKQFGIDGKKLEEEADSDITG